MSREPLHVNDHVTRKISTDEDAGPTAVLSAPERTLRVDLGETSEPSSVAGGSAVDLALSSQPTPLRFPLTRRELALFVAAAAIAVTIAGVAFWLGWMRGVVD